MEAITNLPPTGMAILLTVGMMAMIATIVAMAATGNAVKPTFALLLFLVLLSAALQMFSTFLT
ncbi:hypothetical protein V8C40DRAFT_251869 [Trichoderma camerunense]